MNTMMTCKRLTAYEQLMRETPSNRKEISEDFLCKGCKYHRPDWDYRFCVHIECPFMKGMKTFWEEVYEDGGE